MSNSKIRNLALTVTIIRHAETDLSAKIPRVISGQGNQSLTADGLKQAKALSNRLKKHQFTHIYSSDSTQCNSTADEIKLLHPNAIIIQDARLREIDLGEFSGMSWKKVKQFLKSVDQHFEEYVSSKSESFDSFDRRVMAFYADVIIQHIINPHDDILHEIQKSLQDIKIINSDVETTTPGEIAAIRKKSLSSLNSLHPPILSKTSQFNRESSADSLISQESNESVEQLSKDSPNQARLKNINILIITHGGWIDSLMRQLIEDLNFETEKVVLNNAFPKVAGVFQFKIFKMLMPPDDYEWKGVIEIMNSTSHLANYSKIGMPPLPPKFNHKRPDMIKIQDIGSPSSRMSPRNDAQSPSKGLMRMFGFKSKNLNFLSTGSGRKSSPIVSSPLKHVVDNSSRFTPVVKKKSLGW